MGVWARSRVTKPTAYQSYATSVSDGANDELGETGEREADIKLRALEHQHCGYPLGDADKGNGNATAGALLTTLFFARLHASTNAIQSRRGLKQDQDRRKVSVG